MRIGEIIILQSHDSGSGLDHLPLSGANNNNRQKRDVAFDSKEKKRKEKEKDDLIH